MFVDKVYSKSNREKSVTHFMRKISCQVFNWFCFLTQCYPSVFITAYENDQRIPLMGVLRYVQKLRKAALHHARTKGKNITDNRS